MRSDSIAVSFKLDWAMQEPLMHRDAILQQANGAELGQVNILSELIIKNPNPVNLPQDGGTTCFHWILACAIVL
eukprot:3679186-Amphidinium_carterae.1